MGIGAHISQCVSLCDAELLVSQTTLMSVMSSDKDLAEYRVAEESSLKGVMDRGAKASATLNAAIEE